MNPLKKEYYEEMIVKTPFVPGGMHTTKSAAELSDEWRAKKLKGAIYDPRWDLLQSVTYAFPGPWQDYIEILQFLGAMDNVNLMMPPPFKDRYR